MTALGPHEEQPQGTLVAAVINLPLWKLDDEEDIAAVYAVRLALAEAQSGEFDLQRDLRQANFHRDKLAERLTLVEAAVAELDCALSFDSTFDPDHWRGHVSSALDICRRATRKRGDSDA